MSLSLQTVLARHEAFSPCFGTSEQIINNTGPSRFVLRAVPTPEKSTPAHLTPKRVFPTLGSLEELVDSVKAGLPAERFNEVYAIMMTYHNTLLAELTRSRQ